MYKQLSPLIFKPKILSRVRFAPLFLKSSAAFSVYYNEFEDVLLNPPAKKEPATMYIEDVRELHKNVNKSNELIEKFVEKNIIQEERDFYNTQRVLRKANEIADFGEDEAEKNTQDCFSEKAAAVLQNPAEFMRTKFANLVQNKDRDLDEVFEDGDEFDFIEYEESIKKQAETFQKATFVAMMRAGCHYGARAVDSNPFMHQFLLCEREGQHIFDITKSLAALRKVMLVLQNIVSEDGAVWFVGNSDASKDFVEELAMDCGECFIKTEAKRGMLTNFNIFQRNARDISKMDIKKTSQEQAIAKYYHHAPYRIKNTPPAMVVVLNMAGNETLVHEARRKRIPTACICDSDTNPNHVAYVIPGNDKSPHSVRFIMEMLSMTIKETKRQIHERESLFKKKTEEEEEQDDRELTEKVRRRLYTNNGLLQVEMLNPRKFGRKKEKETFLTKEDIINEMKNIRIEV